MSTLVSEPVSAMGMDDDSLRAQKLANAKKKLKTFRANRSIDTEPSLAPSTGTFLFPSASLSASPIPLVTDIGGNAAWRHSREMKEKDLDLPPFPASTIPASQSPGKLRKPRSKGSMSHRRQASSVTLGGSSGGLNRGSVMGLFESEELEARPLRGPVPRLAPSEIITTPATPLPDDPEAGTLTTREDPIAVKERLTTFSFGAKPPTNPRSDSRERRVGQPLLPSQLLPSDDFPSPNASPSKRLSTPVSRPPSLLLTRPTPLAFGSPSPSGASNRLMDIPQTPPTPARSKRHSHTRSNSISLPSLKLNSRPASLGVPSSPSFPSSPSSPATSRPTTLGASARLKFEPSGRGAEAELGKDESRRKALEKLTGSPSLDIPDSPRHEIALPDLDDEDLSSVASSARPHSGFGSFTFGRPASTSSTPSVFSWTNGESSPPPEQWSADPNGKSDEKDDILGFGFTFSGNGSGSFSFGSAAPASALPNHDTGLGMGLPSTMPVRPAISRNLSVLAEVDEPEDGDAEQDLPTAFVPGIQDHQAMPLSPTAEEIAENQGTIPFVPIAAPAPLRLRELHLVSSSSPASTGSGGASNTPSRLGSPTKGYGAIGRGRPGPLANVSTDSPASTSSIVSTPKSAGSVRRRAGPGSGSRGSSISYKRDGESTSSRDWGMGNKMPFSPTDLSDTSSPSQTFSPHYSGWGSVPRSGSSRPCPRPKSLASVGHDNRGAGRVLGEVEEVDEDALSSRNPSYRLSSAESNSDQAKSEHSRDSFGVFGWRDPQLELELERDELREDVELWRQRCAGLEDKLDLEKKENVVLRDRLRKLGDRVSSMSSYPDTNRDTSLVADLRTQLFGVKAQMERERTQKLSALDRVAELEARLKAITGSNEATGGQSFLGHVFSPAPLLPAAPSPKVLDDPSSPKETASRFDPVGRMRAWGFPREPFKPAQSTRSKRESFFGLSQVLQRGSDEHERGEMGVDLPPFVLPTETLSAGNAQPLRVVSDPIPVTSAGVGTHGSFTEDGSRSISLTASASTALSFLSDYLPKYSKPTSLPPLTEGPLTREPRAAVKQPPGSEHKGVLDFRKACRCCVGEVLEV